MTTASSKAKKHGNTARTLFLQGRLIEARKELKVSTKWKGITKRKQSVDAMLQATIVYPFDLETYS